MSSTIRFSVIGVMLLTAVMLGLFVMRLSHPVSLPTETAAITPLPVAQTAYLVAAHALPAGTLLRDDDFKSLASAVVPADGAIVDSPEARMGLRGSLIREFLDGGLPILADIVLRPRDRGFIASVLETGTRAVTISVDPVSGVAGLIWPGDHVDIILTQEIDKASLAHHVLSETVLTNIRIIAIDQQMVQGAPSDSPTAGKTVHTVTVQVDPAQAEKIALADHLGKLTLSIRSALDQTAESSDRVTFGSDVSPALSSTDRPTGRIVTVIGGNERKEVSFP